MAFTLTPYITDPTLVLQGKVSAYVADPTQTPAIAHLSVFTVDPTQVIVSAKLPAFVVDPTLALKGKIAAFIADPTANPAEAVLPAYIVAPPQGHGDFLMGGRRWE